MPLCLTPHLFKQCGAPFRVIFLLQQFVVHTVQLALGHIPAQIQQFPDTGRRLFTGDEGGAGTLGAFALGNADSLGVVPDGITPFFPLLSSANLRFSPASAAENSGQGLYPFSPLLRRISSPDEGSVLKHCTGREERSGITLP